MSSVLLCMGCSSTNNAVISSVGIIFTTLAIEVHIFDLIYLFFCQFNSWNNKVYLLQEEQKRQEEERIRMENILSGNPLLNYSSQATKSDLKVSLSVYLGNFEMKHILHAFSQILFRNYCKIIIPL